MNLLKEGIEQKAVVKTVITRKLTVDGITRAYPVYKVRLDWLFYNDQNDRIATWISQYKSEHNGQIPDVNDMEAYNSIIDEFIVFSNPEAIQRTQKNIELVEQREPGVVLADGRIIDGNRRFTCLRHLAQGNDRFKYFETVILARDIENNAKQIKMLELSIQHGEENRVDYNPVDRLVGIYNDVVDTHLLSVEEYARSTNEPEAEVTRRVEIAKLMVEFLEFVNAPKQFYIARDMQITSTLEELFKLINRCHNEDEKEDLKIAVFNNILMHTSTDMSRFVRNFKSVIGTDYQDEFLEEQKALAERVIEKLPPVGKVNTSVIRNVIRSQADVIDEMDRSVEKAITKVRRKDTRNRPIKLVEKAADCLEDVDLNILRKMNDSEIQRLMRQISRLDTAITQLKGIIDVDA